MQKSRKKHNQRDCATKNKNGATMKEKKTEVADYFW